jgi:TonB family protein
LELEFTVAADGTLTQVSVLWSNSKAVDPLALEMVRAWRFKPIVPVQVLSGQLAFRPRD